MDPNACLDRIKSARQDFMDAVDRTVWPHKGDRAQAMERAGEELAGAIEDLDEWLRKGGSLPGAWQSPDDVIEMQSAVHAAEVTASGDSNDEEIDALQEALELALRRWPTVNYDR